MRAAADASSTRQLVVLIARAAPEFRQVFLQKGGGSSKHVFCLSVSTPCSHPVSAEVGTCYRAAFFRFRRKLLMPKTKLPAKAKRQFLGLRVGAYALQVSWIWLLESLRFRLLRCHPVENHALE